MLDVLETPIDLKDFDMTINYQTGDDFHETLTAALTVLRARADDQGVRQESVKRVLNSVGLTDSQVSNVLDFLRALRLYTTETTGFQTCTYTVALEPAVVTPAMVKTARKRLNKSKVKQSKEKTSTDVVTDDTLLRLADIITALEKQVADLTTERDKLASKLETATNRIGTRDRQLETEKQRVAKRDEQLTAAKSKITELETELAAAKQTPAVVGAKKVTDILERYSKE